MGQGDCGILVKSSLYSALVLVTTAALLTAVFSGFPSLSAQAVSGSLFDPGDIISDAEFFDADSMTPQQIQQFLESQACSSRDGAPCMRSYQLTTTSIAAVGGSHCKAYQGAANESASTIIWKVGQACSINPRVLLVLVQKEQSLVSSPRWDGYTRATGYGCPDTAACDTKYYGFFNQVYRAAWQFRQYTLTPDHWRYRIGPTAVQYHPNLSCGSSVVPIRNQATANLYNYTPYQPNPAALANLYGTGDGCSSYGNRNFWRIYYDWFGSPTDTSPLGIVENMQPVANGIGIWGWTLDTDDPAPLTVHVYLDGRMVLGAAAADNRSDIGSRFGLGSNHGFALSVPAGPGPHSVCVYAINVGEGSNKTLGCHVVTVLTGNPMGVVDNIQPRPGGFGIWGWAIDPDSSDPISVHFYVDGRMVKGIVANVNRSDLTGIRPGYGTNHAFAETLDVSPGPHTVCAYAINIGPGTTNPSLGCHSVVAGGSPLGQIDRATSGIGKIAVSGWLIDPDTTEPIMAHLYLDGRMVAGLGAHEERTDMGVYSSFGGAHGFSAEIPATAGKHDLCVYGINVGSGSNTLINCQGIEVGGSPLGRIENMQPQFGAIGVWGWAYDPDVVAPAMVHIYVDGNMRGGFGANVPRSDLDIIPAEYGNDHAFGASVPASPGTHQVCVYVINIGYGQNTNLGCIQVAVSGDPVGVLENIQPVAGGLGIWGHAVDPDTDQPITVRAYVDDVLVGTASANQSRADLADRYPGYGASHAFGLEVPAAPGHHKVCVTATNQGAGADVSLGCVMVLR